MKASLAGLVLASLVLAGCAGSDSEPEALSVLHNESSEMTVIEIRSVPSEAMIYEEIAIHVDGKAYAFGQFASFDARRYQVQGKTDAREPVEFGDRITVLAAGRVQVQMLWMDEEVASFEANIPDNKAPAAPVVFEPAAEAGGVSRMPTFRWSSVTDPSGLSYTLAYSLDPNLQAPVLTTRVESLSANMHAVPAGKELMEGMKYYWQVQAVDGAGNASPWSQVSEFTVEGSAAGA